MNADDQLKKICGSNFALRQKNFCDIYSLSKGQNIDPPSLKSSNSFIVG